MNYCAICGNPNVDRAHVKTKGSGGTMEQWNISFLCRLHHTEQHKIGIITFIKKYPAFWEDLKSKGWKLETVFHRERLIHDPRTKT